MKTYLFKLIVLLSVLTTAISANSQPWNGKPCAVVLTYDDAIDAHLDHAVPALDSFGLKGTFYLIGGSGAVGNRIPEWRKAATRGHELGNHTGYHPCSGSEPNRSFVKPENDLDNYTIGRMKEEIRLTNVILKAIDGKTERTFAFPCGDEKIHDTPYYEAVKKDFIAARGASPKFLHIDSVHLHDINAYAVNGESADTLIKMVKKAQQTQTLLVFMFHGVGGGHDLNVGLSEHSQLLRYLKANENEIWISTMIEVAKYIKARKHDW